MDSWWFSKLCDAFSNTNAIGLSQSVDDISYHIPLPSMFCALGSPEGWFFFEVALMKPRVHAQCQLQVDSSERKGLHNSEGSAGIRRPARPCDFTSFGMSVMRSDITGRVFKDVINAQRLASWSNPECSPLEGTTTRSLVVAADQTDRGQKVFKRSDSCTTGWHGGKVWKRYSS